MVSQYLATMRLRCRGKRATSHAGPERGRHVADKFFGSHEIRETHETVKGSSNRSFGLVFTGFFAVLAGLSIWRHGSLWPLWLGLSAVFLIAALAAPRVLDPLNALWTRFGLLLHAVTSPVILAIVFYGCITPIGWLMRRTGKDPLRRRFEPELTSYWLPRDPPGPAPETFSQQF